MIANELIDLLSRSKQLPVFIETQNDLQAISDVEVSDDKIILTTRNVLVDSQQYGLNLLIRAIEDSCDYDICCEQCLISKICTHNKAINSNN